MSLQEDELNRKLKKYGTMEERKLLAEGNSIILCINFGRQRNDSSIIGRKRLHKNIKNDMPYTSFGPKV